MREHIWGFPNYSCEWVNVFITGVMGDAFVSHGFSISQQMTFPWILHHMGLHNVDDDKNHACDTLRSPRQLRLQRKYKLHPSIFMKICTGLFLQQVYIPHHRRKGPFGLFTRFVFLACLNFRRKWLLFEEIVWFKYGILSNQHHISTTIQDISHNRKLQCYCCITKYRNMQTLSALLCLWL